MKNNNKLVDKLKCLSEFVGKTPTRKLSHPKINLYAKLEYMNFSGSLKDRPAFNIISKAIESGQINEDTTIVESSSGNFAIALSSICNELGLKFIPVIDPNINKGYEDLLRIMNEEVVKVTKVDKTDGFLLSRIAKVKEICTSRDNTYWPNQYQNPNNYMSYYNSLGLELGGEFEQLDYVFIGVSSGGTITGTSRRLKEKFPSIQIVAVDVEGSVVFQNNPQKRYISGIGASMVPVTLEHAKIDHVVMVPQYEVITGAMELLDQHTIFSGASTGAVYSAINKFFGERKLDTIPNVAFLCADKGFAYLDTVFDKKWGEKLKNELLLQNI